MLVTQLVPLDWNTKSEPVLSKVLYVTSKFMCCFGAQSLRRPMNQKLQILHSSTRASHVKADSCSDNLRCIFSGFCTCNWDGVRSSGPRSWAVLSIWWLLETIWCTTCGTIVQCTFVQWYHMQLIQHTFLPVITTQQLPANTSRQMGIATTTLWLWCPFNQTHHSVGHQSPLMRSFCYPSSRCRTVSYLAFPFGRKLNWNSKMVFNKCSCIRGKNGRL